MQDMSSVPRLARSCPVIGRTWFVFESVNPEMCGYISAVNIFLFLYQFEYKISKSKYAVFLPILCTREAYILNVQLAWYLLNRAYSVQTAEGAILQPCVPFLCSDSCRRLLRAECKGRVFCSAFDTVPAQPTQSSAPLASRSPTNHYPAISREQESGREHLLLWTLLSPALLGSHFHPLTLGRVALLGSSNQISHLNIVYFEVVFNGDLLKHVPQF